MSLRDYIEPSPVLVLVAEEEDAALLQYELHLHEVVKQIHFILSMAGQFVRQVIPGATSQGQRIAKNATRTYTEIVFH